MVRCANSLPRTRQDASRTRQAKNAPRGFKTKKPDRAQIEKPALQKRARELFKIESLPESGVMFHKTASLKEYPKKRNSAPNPTEDGRARPTNERGPGSLGLGKRWPNHRARHSNRQHIWPILFVEYPQMSPKYMQGPCAARAIRS